MLAPFGIVLHVDALGLGNQAFNGYFAGLGVRAIEIDVELAGIAEMIEQELHIWEAVVKSSDFAGKT